MTALAQQASHAPQAPSKRRLLLASDRSDQSSELANILSRVGEVETITTSDIPTSPRDEISGIVVDINLRSPESVQLVRNRLRADAYSAMPRLFVLAEALHHASMQAWALGERPTPSRGRSRRAPSCSASAPRFPTPSAMTPARAARR